MDGMDLKTNKNTTHTKRNAELIKFILKEVCL